MTESTTPGNPFGRGPRDEAGYAPTGPAGWAAYFAAGTAAQEVPENLPIIERLGDWHVFGKRPSTWGEIYFCVPAPESRIAAVLKALPRDLTFDAEARRAFQRECAIGLLASFYAFGILPVLGIHVQDGRPFIVMPAVMAGPRGEVNLRDLLRVGPVPLADAVFFARTIAEALATAGKHLPGLVHGDLKPENILIWNRIPFIADFGLARCAARRLGGDSLVGTPEYRAPEADDPRAVLDTSADVYSYGVILTETLTGRPPDRGELATSRSRALVTRALLDLANRCRRQDPAARPSDFTAIIAAIEEIAPAAEWPGPEIAKVMLMADLLRVAQTRSQVALDLLRLEQYDMAIDFIESSTDPDSRDAELWMHHGTALSLSDPPRDEEALGSYQRALAVLPAADTEKSWRIGIELAASLKRLRRFDEAEALLESLIEEAPDENWFYSSANNLGALWTDKGLHHEADKLLSQVVAKLPDFAQAWHNRAWAQQRMGNMAAAALMQQRAVAADPANPRWHARLGMILMDELCFLDDAATAFSNAMACGSLEPEVMTRALACAVATGDQRRAEDLLSKIGAAYGHDVPEHAVSTANRWVFWLQRKFGGPGGPASGELPEAVAQALAEVGLSDPLETPTPGETAEPAFSDSGDAADGDTPRTAADVTDLSGSDADDRSRLDSEPDQGVPDQRFHHLQLRLAATGFAYMDFYEPFDEQDYGHAFRGQYRRAWVTAPMMGGVLADTPFHLLRCLSCSAELASNRPDGSSLRSPSSRGFSAPGNRCRMLGLSSVRTPS